ncbi:protein FAR1-RELATED SEQUENCE 5-like [Quercus robur]|uniref:protein FAR1-RELATED SEQUENCE 5-like n=1 Tax=Quercus robur TaxID=38942 RepID=UPI002162487D|nr:protein FAR1-RELATED SEQUENCE 5-like [Quercus robur]
MADQDIRVNEEGIEDIETLLGMVVHSEDEAYKLYNDYAIRIGFSVRKEKIRYAKNVVTHFNPTHNHELAKPEERPFLRSNRKITDAQLGVIKTFKEAGIRTISAYSYLVEEAGGFENVGFIKRDCYNVVNKQKLINVEAGDAQSLVNHFKQKQAEDPMFFYAIQVDQENQMTNFFWGDGRSRIDYNSFGDVICFDTY